MPRSLRPAYVAMWLLVFWAAPAMAGPIPFVTTTPNSTYEVVATEKVATKVENTKAWLRKKKTQTTRWMGRQKQKLKRIVR